MAGYDAPYVPGWDCHGLPIEIKVDETAGRQEAGDGPGRGAPGSAASMRRSLSICRGRSSSGWACFGRWDERPYAKTMDFAYEASILETFYGFYEKGFVYKGLKPVYWCSHDRTALAEAEVEYEMHTSPSVYVRYKLTSDARKMRSALCSRVSRVYTIIWTTTPWTLPASMAVAFGPEVEYVALGSSRRRGRGCVYRCRGTGGAGACGMHLGWRSEERDSPLRSLRE